MNLFGDNNNLWLIVILLCCCGSNCLCDILPLLLVLDCCQGRGGMGGCGQKFGGCGCK